MNGNSPVQSLYTTPVCLSADAPKQKILMIDSSSTSVMRAGPLLLVTLLLSLSKMRPGMGGCSMGKDALGSVNRHAVGLCQTVVLCRPLHGCFMWHLDVAGLGMRYFCTVYAVKCGAPLRKSHLMAQIKEETGGLHKLWCINLTSFSLVVRWYEKPAVWWAITGGIGV
jgi:hypothetical protein